MRRFDAPRALGRLASAAVCVGALAGPLAGVAQAQPQNDLAANASPITMVWTNALQLVGTVPYTDWSTATSSVGEPVPSCTGTDNGHSQWWSVSVKESS